MEWYPDSIAASKQSNPELGGIPTMIKPISFVPYFHEKQMHPEVGRLSTQGFSNFLALLLIGFPFALIVAVDHIRRSNGSGSDKEKVLDSLKDNFRVSGLCEKPWKRYEDGEIAISFIKDSWIITGESDLVFSLGPTLCRDF